jgi:hypothetical protein
MTEAKNGQAKAVLVGEHVSANMAFENGTIWVAGKRAPVRVWPGAHTGKSVTDTPTL